MADTTFISRVTTIAATWLNQINRQVYGVSSITALKQLDSTIYTRVRRLGYYSLGDSPIRNYYMDPADHSSADNGGSVIVAADGARWKFNIDDSVNVTDFGALMNVSTAGQRTVNSAALLAMLSISLTAKIPAGTLWVASGNNLGTYWHIQGMGAQTTFLKGDGDLFSASTSNNGEMRLIEQLTILNDVTPGKHFTNTGTTNTVEFNHVNFGTATYHIYSSGGDAVAWKMTACRFTGATVESRHFEGLWAYTENEACYTWFNTIGMRCTNGNVSSCSTYGSVWEQNDDSAVVLEVTNAAFEVDGFHIIGGHFEVNGKVTNNADVQLLTTAASRMRDVGLRAVGLFSPTATQAVRVSLSQGGGGNILAYIKDVCHMGNVALCTNVSAVAVDNIYAQALALPAGVSTAPQVLVANNGTLGENTTTGANVGSSVTVATTTLPAGTKMADFTVQGNIYNGGANTHTGYLIGKYYASGNRIVALSDVNNGSGSNQGFVATYSAGTIVISNKAAMTNNQSGDVTCIFHS